MSLRRTLAWDSFSFKLVIFLLALSAFPGRLLPCADATLWPAPTNISHTGRQLYFHPRHFEFRNAGKESTILDQAFQRYTDLILDNSYPSSLSENDARDALSVLTRYDAITRVSVFVVSSDQSLGLQTSETYTLRVNAPTVIIHATDVFGALRAMESLAQLAEEIEVPPEVEATLHPDVAADLYEDNNAYSSFRNFLMDAAYSLGLNLPPAAPTGLRRKQHSLGRHFRSYKKIVVVNETSIWDTPRFRHRGLLIDTARHFLPIPVIKSHLDAMAMAKLNVLHWHLVDDQSFPYVSDHFPELAEKGAFAPSAVYTGADIDDIVNYARSRGIRIIPEFDTPGHVASWGKSHPEILTTCGNAKGGVKEEGEVVLGPMDPSKNATYALLWQLLREASARFPDNFVHLGGDEVDLECWKSNDDVKEWMQEQGIGKDVAAALTVHVKKVIELAEAAGKEGIVWQEAADAPGGKELPQSTIVHVWKWAAFLQPGSGRELSTPSRRSTLAMGNDISGADASLYLEKTGKMEPSSSTSSKDDYWLSELQKVTKTHRAVLSAPWYLNLAAAGDERAWESYWKVDPQSFSADEDQKERVIGGEACVWGELVDATNALQKTWPLAGAVAGRLWSDESMQDVDDARERLKKFRCRLISRGIPAAPLEPGMCRVEATLN